MKWRDWVVAKLTRDDRTPNTGRPGSLRPVAGVFINADTALRNDTVWACVRYLSQTVGQLAARVMRDQGEYSVRVNSHPVANVFQWRANSECGPFQLKETLTAWAVTRGNGVAEIERDNAGRVIALWPIHPDRLEIERDLATDRLVYRVRNGTGETVDLDAMDVFHLRGFGHGPVGLSVVEHAAETIGWAQATELFGASFFGNGLSPSGVIEGAGALSDAGQDRLRAQIQLRHGGPRRAHNPMFLDKGLKWVASSSVPKESQFVETMQHQVEAICRWFGVPPHKVSHLLRSTFSNIEHQAIEVVVDSITPWALRWEEEANYKLFGQNRAGFYLKLDLKSLLRGDFKARQEGLQIMRRNGVIDAREWRDLEDMGPHDGEGLDALTIEGAMTTLERLVAEPMDAPPPPAANDPVDPEEPDAPDDPEDDGNPTADQMARIEALRSQVRGMLDAA